MPTKELKITRTPFKAQATVISNILRTNPILNDEDKASLNETVGVLTWLNQLQLGWLNSKAEPAIPENIRQLLFEGRKPEPVAVPPS